MIVVVSKYVASKLQSVIDNCRPLIFDTKNIDYPAAIYNITDWSIDTHKDFYEVSEACPERVQVEIKSIFSTYKDMVDTSEIISKAILKNVDSIGYEAKQVGYMQTYSDELKAYISTIRVEFNN